MRLTLRTMLAHIDGILEPEDDEDIRKKIADSEFATNLLHRIRDVMRRLRLGAPGLGSRATGLDPNTVAEYLDNALQDGQVADFEKVCLESDVQLAEVASAHQVLTLVLGEPVEIDPEARQRMYRLPQVAVEAEKAAEVRRREKPGVPEYLREPPRKRWGLRVAAVLAVAILGVVAASAWTGRLDPWLERLGLPPQGAEVAARPDAEGLAAEPERPDAAVPDQGPVLAQDEPAAPPAPVDVPSTPDAADPTTPAEPESPVESVPEAPPVGPDPQAPPAQEEPGLPGVELVLPEQPEPGDEPALLPADPSEPMPEPGVLPRAPLPEDLPGTTPDPALVPGAGEPGDPGLEAGPELLPGEEVMERPSEPAPLPEGPIPGLREPVAPEGPAPPPESTEAAPVGRLVSDRQLLLQPGLEPGAWDRVPMQTAVKPEQPLLALPTYRPVVALTAGLTMQLVGPAEVELLPPDDEGVSTLEVTYGRLTMHTLGRPGMQIRLAVGDRRGTITFAEAESAIALHVDRLAQPGEDPESKTAPLSVSLWATRGSVIWQGAGEEPVRLGATAGVALGSAAPKPPEPRSAAPPAWIAEDQTSFLDRRASAVLADEISVDRPASLALHEVAAGHRQREVRWLAVRCLGYLGHFDPMVAVLGDEESKTVWFEYIAELRAALARDPRLAVAVRESLRKQYGDEAETLYRMLWGYSAEDLRNGAAAELVEALEHERLAVRLLSFWNLREITGLGLFYRPELSAAKRQQPVQRWRERLASGEIARKADDTPLED